MRRTIALVLLGSCMITVRPALAESEPSCETVTTVRCTGSAAPLALPGNAPVAAPVQIRLSAPPPSPQALPPQPLPPQEDDAEVPVMPARPSCCAAPPPSFAPLAAMPGGWHLVQEGGELMLQRKKRTGIASLWGPGLAVWMLSFAGTAYGGVRDERPWAAIPFFGGFVAAGVESFEGSTPSRVIGYTAGSLLQLGGFITFLVGVSLGEKIERMPLRITPTASRDGGGLSLTARF